MKINFKSKVLLFIFIITIITSLWAKNIYILFVFSVLSWLIIPYNKWWDKTSISLLIFSILYAIIAILNNVVGSIFVQLSYFIVPVAFYRFGRWSMYIFNTDDSRQHFLIVTILGYLIFLFILTIIDITIVGWVNTSRILLGDVSSNENVQNATMYGMMTSIGISCIVSLFMNKQKVILRILFIIIAALSILVSVHLVNRSVIFISAGCMIIPMFILFKQKPLKLLIILLLIITTILIVNKMGILNQDILDAYTAREEVSNEYTSMSEFGGRSDLWNKSISNLFKYPLGWNGRFAHNLWLDIARVGGLLPFFSFIISTFLWLISLIKLFTKKKFQNTDIIIISLNIGLTLISFIEPIIDASLLFFGLFIMVWGISKSLIKEKIIDK